MKNYLIVAGVSLAIGLAVGCGFGYDQADAKRIAEISKINTAHTAAKEAALERSRKWYRDAMSEQQTVLEKLQNDLNKNESDKRRADAARDGLLVEYRRLLTGLSANNCNPASVANGEAAACAGDLPAELFGELDKLAGEYAIEADRSRARGVGCEKSYDALKEKAP